MDPLYQHRDALGPNAKAAAAKAPVFRAKPADPKSWIQPVPNQPLMFRTSGQAQDVTLAPAGRGAERDRLRGA